MLSYHFTQFYGRAFPSVIVFIQFLLRQQWPIIRAVDQHFHIQWQKLLYNEFGKNTISNKISKTVFLKTTLLLKLHSKIIMRVYCLKRNYFTFYDGHHFYLLFNTLVLVVIPIYITCSILFFFYFQNYLSPIRCEC